MPSIFALEGTSHRGRKKKRKSRGLGDSMSVGDCKIISVGKGGKRKWCKVGKSKKHPSGFAFKKM